MFCTRRCAAIGLLKLRKFEIVYISVMAESVSPEATIVIDMHPDEWLIKMNKRSGYPSYQILRWSTVR